jgi:hypothetical protein
MKEVSKIIQEELEKALTEADLPRVAKAAIKVLPPGTKVNINRIVGSGKIDRYVPVNQYYVLLDGGQGRIFVNRDAIEPIESTAVADQTSETAKTTLKPRAATPTRRLRADQTSETAKTTLNELEITKADWLKSYLGMFRNATAAELLSFLVKQGWLDREDVYGIAGAWRTLMAGD